ncbi:MAG: DUF4864 domain-containing protein [Chloroflexi bacterium]|nr:DUF4864 domain-containing protein [Chloroflexota bacterium]
MGGDTMNFNADDLLPQPIPELPPQMVVKIQLEALQKNDDPEPDYGIRVAFQFASPANRAVTGPIDRFIQLVRNPIYAPMLNWVGVEYGPINVMDAEAQQIVAIMSAEGETIHYVFTLSRQKLPPYMGCWMTDNVLRIDLDEDAL